MIERSGLFREDSIGHKSRDPYSSLVIYQRVSVRLGVLVVVSFLCLILFLLGHTSYKQTIVTKGILESSAGLQEVNSPVAAVLSRIYVDVGDRVVAGQLLASLSGTVFNHLGKPAHNAEIGLLSSEREYLSQQMMLQEELFSSSKRRNSAKQRNLQLTETSLSKEKEIVQAQLLLSETQLDGLRVLLRGSNISKSPFDQNYGLLLNLRLRHQELAQRTQRTNHELSDSRQAFEELALNFEQVQLQWKNETEEIDRRITILKNQENITVVANAAGLVAAVAVRTGESVVNNQKLFSIQAHGHELQASLFAPARVQGRLYPGQEVLLSYDAFDYRRYGRYSATIDSISQASLDPREHLIPVPGITQSVFKITANLEQEYVESSDIFRLQPGMLLTADFVVSEMSLLRYIFKPLLALKGKV